MATIEELQRLVTLRGTKTQVEALSATLEEVVFAYATDTAQIGIYTNGGWVWIGGGGSALNDLSDVTITSPTSGQALTYNGSAWVNGEVAGSAEVLMADGQATATPLANEADDDWVYGE